MISKSLILFLLACALALANPIQGKPAPQAQNVVNIRSWLELAHKQIKSSYVQTVQPFKKSYKALIEASKKVREYSQDKLEQLRNKFLEITAKSREMLTDVENSILMTRIVDLQQNVSDLLATISFMVEQYQQGINQNNQPGQHQPGSQNPQNPHKPLNNFDFKGFMGGLKKQLNIPDFQSLPSKESSKTRSALQDIVGNMNFMNNIPSRFSQFIPQQLPTNMNQLEGFLPQQGLESLGNNFNGFVNQAQGVLNGGISGIPNNPFTPTINNFLGSLEGIGNDMSQTLSIVQKQISQAFSIEINQLKDALMQWANEVDGFLANGRNFEESQIGGFLPSVPLPHSNGGPFSNFGKKIGGSIGGGVDKFNNAVGGFLGNAGKLFSG